MATPEHDIAAVLEESGPDYDDFSFERPTAGHQGDVFMVTLEYAGEEYEVVVKFEQEDLGFALEPFLHEFVADRTEVPVPRILVFQDEPERDVEPYFVTERVHGESLVEILGDLQEETFEQVVEHAGSILGDMHAEIGFEGFGTLALEDDRLVVDNFSWDWQEFFGEIVDDYIDRLGDTPFADLQTTAQQQIEDSLPVIKSDAVPRLVHDDFRPANVMFDRAGTEPISAVLDWQLALAADPEYHIARTDFLFVDPAFRDTDTRSRLRKRLYKGYREHRPFDPDDGYEKRRTVYHFSTLLWRMAGFDAAFAEFSDLAQGRAEARFRQQFDQLAARLPE
ncbi:phosphotransferase family protein [Halovenus salina]|uniref:Phosphotransferase family protein n=1 Tax=Halovenus salina TaxID=1510225 RepID=A0ABD5VUX9_9EURY|nr:phosphotransferase [Halovenus salina]